MGAIVQKVITRVEEKAVFAWENEKSKFPIVLDLCYFVHGSVL